MNILITNDDGYQSKGIKVLVSIMKQFGNVNVIAPMSAQSGMSMAVSLGAEKIAFKPLTPKEVGRLYKAVDENSTNGFAIENGNTETWAALDATPATCVKFALDAPYLTEKPDLVVSGINHGANYATASCYSGTLGATAEACLNGILGIGVSLDEHIPDADFSAIEALLPGIIQKLLKMPQQANKYYYNINFPALPIMEIKDVKAGYMGRGRWIKELKSLDELICNEDRNTKLYKLVGEFVSNPDNTEEADHLLIKNGYVSIVPHAIDSTDYEQLNIIKNIF